MRASLLATLVSTLFLFACLPKRESKSSAKEWIEPQELNLDVFRRAKKKKSLFIYYANDSVADNDGGTVAISSETRLLQILRNGQDKQNHAAQLLKALQKDRDDFSDTLMRAATALNASRCSQSETKFASGLVFFRNQWPDPQVCTNRSGEIKLESPYVGKSPLKINFHAQSQFPYEAHPLAQEENLVMALAAVAEKFSPDEFSYTLLVASHGHPDKLITTKLAVDVNKLAEEKGDDFVLRAFMQKRMDDGGMLDKEDESAPLAISADGSVDYTALNLKLFGLSKPDIAVKTAAVPQFGIAKSRFFKILHALHQTLQMEFPIVILQACNSNPASAKTSSEEQIRTREQLSLNKNIGLLFSADNGLSTRSNLNFAKVAPENDYFHQGNFYDGLAAYMRSLVGSK